MTYIPGGGSTPEAGSITIEMLGTEFTALAKTILQKETEQEIRAAIDLDETATMTQGVLGV